MIIYNVFFPRPTVFLEIRNLSPIPFPALRRSAEIRDSKGIYPFGGGLRGGGKPNGFAGLALPDCRRFKSKI